MEPLQTALASPNCASLESVNYTHGKKLRNTSSPNFKVKKYRFPEGWRYWIFDCKHLKAIVFLKLELQRSTEFLFRATEDAICHT